MKRFTVILLLLSLLLTGCTLSVDHEKNAEADTIVENEKQEPSGDKPQKAEGDIYNTQEGNTNNVPQGNTDNVPQDNTDNTSAPPEGAYSLNYNGPADRTYRAAIHGTTAYYECDPYERAPWQPHIYSVPLGEKTEATDLLKGELIALAGDLLIGKTETHFCAMDLTAAKQEWIKLQPAAEYVTHLHDGDTLYLYIKNGEKFFVDVIDLKKLKSKRAETVKKLRKVVKVNGQLFYLTADGLYQGDPTEKNAALLGAATEEDQLHIINDRIFLYRDGTLPRVYDCKAASLYVPEVFKTKVQIVYGPVPETETVTYGGSNVPQYTKLLNGIVTVRYKPDLKPFQTFYYDISTDQEIPDIAAHSPDYTNATVADGGYYLGSSSNDLREYHVNGQTYSANHSALYDTKQKHYTLITETGAIHLYGGAIVTVSSKKSEAAETIHEYQPVTQE